jgi:hypothetical protein
MSNATSKKAERPKPTLSTAQSAFKSEHQQTMLDFTTKRIPDIARATALVDRCFVKLFKEDPLLKDKVGAMIRLFEIIDDGCRNPAKTEKQGKLLPMLNQTA